MLTIEDRGQINKLFTVFKLVWIHYDLPKEEFTLSYEICFSFHYVEWWLSVLCTREISMIYKTVKDFNNCICIFPCELKKIQQLHL